MGIVVIPSFGSDPATITAAALDAKVDGLATEFNGAIDNDNIAPDAAIANSKLNLAAITQNIAHSGTMTHTGTVTITSKGLKLAKGADVASANGLTLGADGNYFDITGTTAITSIGTLGVGTVVRLHFDEALTLTHHATDLILPGGADITTAAGDEAEFVEYASGDWRCTCYTAATGKPVIASVTAASAAEVLTGTEAAKYVAPSTVVSHNGVVKGWCLLDGTGTMGVTDHFNVATASCVDNGTGDYTIAWDTDFGSANNCVVAMAGLKGATHSLSTVLYDTTSNPAAATVRIANFDPTNGNAAVDVDKLCVIAIGDR